LLIFKSTFTSVFKDEKSKRSHSKILYIVEIKVFINFLFVDGRIRIRLRTIRDTGWYYD
jgi:hypothetical protein